MANTYQWAVNQMSAYPEYEGEPNVVFSVSWVCSGTNGVYNAASYGESEMTLDPTQAFTPFSELTLDQVLGWVFNVIGNEGVQKAQDDCDTQIAAQQAPQTVTPPLPWNASN